MASKVEGPGFRQKTGKKVWEGPWLGTVVQNIGKPETHSIPGGHGILGHRPLPFRPSVRRVTLLWTLSKPGFPAPLVNLPTPNMCMHACTHMHTHTHTQSPILAHSQEDQERGSLGPFFCSIPWVGAQGLGSSLLIPPHPPDS